MQVETLLWLKTTGWNRKTEMADAQLVIYFAGRSALVGSDRYAELKSFYPKAHILGCSTGGEIYAQDVLDDSISVAAVRFDHTTLKIASTLVESTVDSFARSLTSFVLESEESDEDVSTALTTAKRERRFVTTVTD